jgi:hypothetical protein
VASNAELARLALYDALAAALPHRVIRNLDRDLDQDELPATVMRDGTPDKIDESFGTPQRHYWFSEQVSLEYTSREEDPDARASLVDAWGVAVADALADATLALPGVVDGIDLAPPTKDTDDVEGGANLASGQITATLYYNSPSPTG